MCRIAPAFCRFVLLRCGIFAISDWTEVSAMFWQVRYQTGEIEDIVNEMKKGNIPPVDVDDTEEMEWVVGELAKHGIYRVEGMPYDKHARDRVKEPEFEFRVAFCSRPAKSNEVSPEELMYIDFYFEPEIEETYDPIGEI